MLALALMLHDLQQKAMALARVSVTHCPTAPDALTHDEFELSAQDHGDDPPLSAYAFLMSTTDP